MTWKAGLIAVLLLSACATPGSTGGSKHGSACADSVAQAFVSGKAPAQSCLGADLQTIDWVGATPFAKSAKYVGESQDQGLTAELYYLTFIDQTGDPGQLVIIWVDDKGVVQGIGISYRVI